VGRKLSSPVFSKKVFHPRSPPFAATICSYCNLPQWTRASPAPLHAPGRGVALAELGPPSGCRKALFSLGDHPNGSVRGHEFLSHRVLRRTLDYLQRCRNRFWKKPPCSRRQSRRHGPRRPDASERFERQRRPESGKRHPRLNARWSRTPKPRTKCPRCFSYTTSKKRVSSPSRSTTGILIGNRETMEERIELSPCDSNAPEKYGYGTSEVIIQNFRAKPENSWPRTDRLCKICCAPIRCRRLESSVRNLTSNPRRTSAILFPSFAGACNQRLWRHFPRHQGFLSFINPEDPRGVSVTLSTLNWMVFPRTQCGRNAQTPRKPRDPWTRLPNMRQLRPETSPVRE